MRTFHVKSGKRFRYIGPGDGYGVMHMVTSVTPKEATTWSTAFRAQLGGFGGDSWLGPPEAFVKHFIPADFPPPA